MMEATVATVKKHINDRVGFNTEGMPDIPVFISDVILPTMERREFTHTSYTGMWHPMFAGRYVMRQDANPMMVYLKEQDLWVVHVFHKLWGDCTEKRYMLCNSTHDIEQVFQAGFASLARLRLEGRVW